jgi:hypothetical protein
LEVDGAFMLPDDMTHDEFLDKLLPFLESINCAFGGATKPEEGRRLYEHNDEAKEGD